MAAFHMFLVLFTVLSSFSHAGVLITTKSSAKRTLTYTQTITTTVTAAYTTVTSPSPVTTTSTITALDTTYICTGTSTTRTSYYTEVITTSRKASKTITVPAPANFTPIQKESYYTLPAVTYTTTRTETYYTPHTVFSGHSKTTAYATRFTGTSTSYYEYYDIAYPTIRTTTTLPARATETVYAACAASNYVTKTPLGRFIDVFEYSINYSGDFNRNYTFGVASHQDCCTMCFRSKCSWNTFDIRQNACILYWSTTDRCDGSEADLGFGGISNSTSPQYYISNGACAQQPPIEPEFLLSG